MLWKSKRANWIASQLLATLQREQVSLTAQQADEYQPILWNDLCSEYDARFLSQELSKLDIAWTEEFRTFWDAWEWDENNHCDGFCRLYSALYGASVEHLLEKLSERKPDFSHLRPFLEDEFRVCLLIAYDEIATTRSYADDFSFYSSLGPACLVDWARLIVADEARHLLNMLRTVQRRHQNRIPEAASLLESILVADRSSQEYMATFVLDHTGPQFSDKMLRGCVYSLLKALNRNVH